MPDSSRSLQRAAPIALPIAALVVLLDQLTKHWALNALDTGPKDVVWTLRFNLAFNSGMAFSRGKGLGPVIGALALVVVVGAVIALARSRGIQRTWALPIGMIVGGAAGNLADRLFRGDGWLRGSVVDFIDFQWWPIFNVADIGVTVGGAWLLLVTARAAPDPTEPADPVANPAAADHG
jgi:signal peptidase II